jgi:hypothetical protein
MKKILVISYSQSGQLKQIVDNFLIPFHDVELENFVIKPKKTFPFPWDMNSFFDVMPESVLEETIEIEAPRFKHDKYDLILFAYQPWYLSPSLPATAILKDEIFGKRLKNTPIVTIIGARNMWLNSQEAIKKMISDKGGNLVANVPLIDRNPNLISVITILHWLGTGKKTKKWGMFPMPGVAEKEINESYMFGEKTFQALMNNDLKNLQKEIISLNKIHINTSLLFVESRAKKLFIIWAKIIKKKGTNPKKRAFWLRIFKNYLYVALFIISPIVLTIYTLLIRPLSQNQIKKNKTYFLNVKPH